jgi:hypothetical protein
MHERRTVSRPNLRTFATAHAGSHGIVSVQNRAVAATAGFAGDGKPPAFCAIQDSESVESFARSPQGPNACVERVTREGRPGLARRTDCAAQWVYVDPKQGYVSRSPNF